MPKPTLGAKVSFFPCERVLGTCEHLGFVSKLVDDKHVNLGVIDPDGNWWPRTSILVCQTAADAPANTSYCIVQ